MDKTDILNGLSGFAGQFSSQTTLGTYKDWGRSALLQDGLSTRGNTIWKRAEYIVLYIDDPKSTTPEIDYINGWKTLCKNYRNQYLLFESKPGKWKMFDYDGNYLGSNRFIDKYLKKMTAKQQAASSQTPQQSPAAQQPTTPGAAYTEQQFIQETFLTKEETEEILTILKKNKNIILQGAPGVGKTWTAKRIAYLMQQEINDSRIESIQFHQSYSYEFFIEGYRPTSTSFELEDGVFLSFVDKAINDPTGKDYFFIIDEINRGNISKIMGELLCLIESTYRGPSHSMKLSYSQEQFYVPDNLYIIGMMNTADRSLSIIDYALRRRFAFISMLPKFDTQEFKDYNQSVLNPKYTKVIDAIKALNVVIEKDPALGKGFEIGHSYFCFGRDVQDLELTTILKYQIIPMLKEYWFDNPSKAADEAKKLLDSVK